MSIELLPLSFGVKPSFGPDRAGTPRIKAQIEKAHKRDDYTCRFCGFRSKQYQRAIPWAEAGDPPFATVCTYCEQVLNLERAGITGAGLLIWLPEISQIDLNHLVRAIYVARAEKGKMAPMATRALDALTLRRSEAKKRLGSDDPLMLATIFRESLDKDDLKPAMLKLDGVRLLPSEKYMMRSSKGDANAFPQIAKFWLSSEGPFGKYPGEKWQESFKAAAASAPSA